MNWRFEWMKKIAVLTLLSRRITSSERSYLLQEKVFFCVSETLTVLPLVIEQQ
jgi:hypothetical protein